MGLHRHIADIAFGAERSWQYSKDRSVLYGAIAVLLIPSAFLIERSLTDPAFDTAIFRLFPTLICIPILFFKLLPQFIRVWFPYYWALALMIVFPFTYSTVLLQNVARSDVPVHPLWQWEFLFSMFVLVQFTSHTKLCVVLFIVGCSLGAASLTLNPSLNWERLYEDVLLVTPVFLITFVVLLISNRHIFKAQEEKLLALRYLGSNMAHELRTPLATIRNLATGTGRLLPVLVDAYKSNSATAPTGASIRSSQLDALADALQTITDEIDHSYAIIDILVLNTLDRPIISLEIEEVPAKEFIEHCLQDFPFSNQFERSLVSVDVSTDFLAFSPRILLKHVIFNLIKNAVRHVQRVRNPKIKVVIDGTDKSISICNNGPEIGRQQRKKIFQQFYTTARIGEGNGIGLSFCKLAMESIDGKISVDSSKRRGTNFKLSFSSSKPRLLPRIAETPDITW